MPISTTFCCEIQPAWLRSNKNRTLPNTSIQGPTKSLLPSCQRTSGKMCRHNLTGYISPRMEANTDFFYLVGLEYYLLKYNGCQLATAEKMRTSPHSTTTRKYSTNYHKLQAKNRNYFYFCGTMSSIFCQKIFSAIVLM